MLISNASRNISPGVEERQSSAPLRLFRFDVEANGFDLSLMVETRKAQQMLFLVFTRRMRVS